MIFNLNPNNNRASYVSRKRFFVTLLFLNTFLGCIYFIHEQKDHTIIQNAISTTGWNNSFNREQHNQYLIKTNRAIQFIQNTLENEYNRDDLIKFYHHVQNEYSLGLKCTRKQNISQAMNTSNVKNPIQRNNRRTSTTVSSSFPTLISSTNQLNSRRRFQRNELYTFSIDNSDACLNESVDLLIIIISKSDNYKTRDAIRRTWASGKNLGIYSSINVKYFFLIDFNEKLSHNIRLENNLFHDIIQVELPQQYTLVTHRVLSLFEWSFRYCRTAKFLFKTDDDIFINLILLLKFISPLIKQPINNSFLISDMTIYGYKHTNPPVFRYANDLVVARYIVTIDEFPCPRYPSFLSGFGYLIPKKARDAILYTAYQDPEPFRLSDVYLTGIIPDYLSIPRQSMSRYYIRFEGDCDNFFNHSKAFACAAGAHHGNSSDVFQKFNRYWQLIKKKHRLIHSLM